MHGNPNIKFPLHLLYRRLVGIQSRCGGVGKISPPPGLDHRTIYLMTIRYTDWDISVLITSKYSKILNLEYGFLVSMSLNVKWHTVWNITFLTSYRLYKKAVNRKATERKSNRQINLFCIPSRDKGVWCGIYYFFVRRWRQSELKVHNGADFSPHLRGLFFVALHTNNGTERIN